MAAFPRIGSIHDLTISFEWSARFMFFMMIVGVVEIKEGILNNAFLYEIGRSFNYDHEEGYYC